MVFNKYKHCHNNVNLNIFNIGYLIEMVYFSIGLDKEVGILYIYNMVKYITYNGVRKQTKSLLTSKREFIQFVGNQFKQLTRKNLGLPMKLYHL